MLVFCEWDSRLKKKIELYLSFSLFATPRPLVITHPNIKLDNIISSINSLEVG